MQSSEKIKQTVRNKYAEIASVATPGVKSECGCCASSSEIGIMKEDYSEVPGYNPGADLGLGCGIPTDLANIKEGDTVLDLGSGAGNDVFIARTIVGDSGKVIGLDMTEEMVTRATRNLLEFGYPNVEFHLGEIESMPVATGSVDVVISNCVLNLVPDKLQAYREVYRVLKPGGHFCISDIVVTSELPQGLLQPAEMYAGCVAGALPKQAYLESIRLAGLKSVQVKREREISLPESLLAEYLSDAEAKTFSDQPVGIFSITVYGEKPLA